MSIYNYNLYGGGCVISMCSCVPFLVITYYILCKSILPLLLCRPYVYILVTIHIYNKCFLNS